MDIFLYSLIQGEMCVIIREREERISKCKYGLVPAWNTEKMKPKKNPMLFYFFSRIHFLLCTQLIVTAAMAINGSRRKNSWKKW